MSDDQIHRRASDAEFMSHMKVCELRFKHQAEQNEAVLDRLEKGDIILEDIRRLLDVLKPTMEEVKLQSIILWGADRQGGLVQTVRETTQDVNRINRTALAIIGLFTTNLGTLIALLYSWFKSHSSSGS